MCVTPNFYRFEIYSNFQIHAKKTFDILIRICFYLQEKQSPAIAPPKHMQTLLIYWP